MACILVYPPPAPGGWSAGWGPQGAQDYTYFDSGFAPGTRQHDGSLQTRQRTKRHRKITGPTKDQKIQIFFNITGVCVCVRSTPERIVRRVPCSCDVTRHQPR